MGNFAGLPESHAWLQQTVSCRMRMERLAELTCAGNLRASSLNASREPFAFPFSNSGLCCSSPTSIFPWLAISWLCFLSFILPSPFLPFSPVSMALLPGSCHRDKSLISASAFLFCPSGWASCIIPHVPACPAPCHVSRLSCRMMSSVALSRDGWPSHYIVLQTPRKLHWLVQSSEGHWISSYGMTAPRVSTGSSQLCAFKSQSTFYLQAARDPGLLGCDGQSRVPVPVNTSATNPCWVGCAGQRQRRNKGHHQGQSFHFPPSVPWLWLQVAAICSWLTAALRDEK